MANTIQGTLVYVCIQTPNKKYQSEEKEFSVGVVVDEDTADNWNEQFPKQPAKVVKTSDFKDEYKIDAPFPSEKKQYVIRLKKPAQYADGNPLPDQYKPKVFVRNGDGDLEDVTMSVLPANGSVGVVSYEVKENSYGSFAKLRNVLVEEMIEYKKAGADPASDFGGSSAPKKQDSGFDEAPAAKPQRKAPAKRAPVVDDEEDESVPF